MPKKGELSSSATADSIRQRKYNSKPDQKRRRAQRNSAHNAAVRIHGKEALQGKDVDHPNSSKSGKLNNNNTRILSIGANRSDGARKSHTGNSRKY
jgi:hypothetical protein